MFARSRQWSSRAGSPARADFAGVGGGDNYGNSDNEVDALSHFTAKQKGYVHG
jgi:hypothetical protein